MENRLVQLKAAFVDQEKDVNLPIFRTDEDSLAALRIRNQRWRTVYEDHLKKLPTNFTGEKCRYLGDDVCYPTLAEFEHAIQRRRDTSSLDHIPTQTRAAVGCSNSDGVWGCFTESHTPGNHPLVGVRAFCTRMVCDHQFPVYRSFSRHRFWNPLCVVCFVPNRYNCPFFQWFLCPNMLGFDESRHGM